MRIAVFIEITQNLIGEWKSRSETQMPLHATLQTERITSSNGPNNLDLLIYECHQVWSLENRCAKSIFSSQMWWWWFFPQAVSSHKCIIDILLAPLKHHYPSRSFCAPDGPFFSYYVIVVYRCLGLFTLSLFVEDVLIIWHKCSPCCVNLMKLFS